MMGGGWLKFDVELVGELISYDASTGKFFWRARDPRHFKSGHQTAAARCARWNGKNAGKQINLAHTRSDAIVFAGRRKMATHIAWRLTLGRWPNGIIDHIDGDPTNYRFGNLRDVTMADNNRNRRVPANNVSGAIGVHWCRRAQRWIARITAQGKKVEVGRSKVFERAVEAWESSPLRAIYHENHGRRSSLPRNRRTSLTAGDTSAAPIAGGGDAVAGDLSEMSADSHGGLDAA